MHARLADADLTGEQIVEIAEHLEEHEELAEEAGAEPVRREKTRQRSPILTRSSTPPWRRFRASRSRTPTASGDPGSSALHDVDR